GQKRVDVDFLHGRHWNSLDDVVRDFRILGNPDWIPVATGGMGEYFCLDLSDEGGGRILLWWSDLNYDEEGPASVARSFTRWLDDFTDELEEGEWTTHPDWSGLVRLDDVEEEDDEDDEE